VDLVRSYCQAQGIFGMPRAGECAYSTVLSLDLASVKASVAGPKRPQDRIHLADLGNRFLALLSRPAAEGGYGKSPEEAEKGYPATSRKSPAEPCGESARPESSAVPLRHGSVLIAAITSCTNTSNPSVMLAAGLLARNAVQRGLATPAHVKTSLAPGSRVVTDYLARSGLQPYLDRLGFQVVGYGCTTCIGNSGPLDPGIEESVVKNDIIAASVLSGNRNFEARVHPSIKANFLMSPPLVVAFALAGRVDVDLEKEPLGKDERGRPVFLRDLWPRDEEIRGAVRASMDPRSYRELYGNLGEAGGLWKEVPSNAGVLYDWDPESTYIREPPYFEGFRMEPDASGDIRGGRALAIFGDSVTTDHISPAGSIKATSPAGTYLQGKGVGVADFNSYGARRGNHEVMVRGTFANVRIKNLLMGGVEGGMTIHRPSGKPMSLYDAALKYAAEAVPLLVFAGQEYGSGSSRDWAAKGTRLLGVKAVIAQSFERIHRSNLVGMGVLPLQFKEGTSARTLGLDGTEEFDLLGIEGPQALRPRKEVTLTIRRAGGATEKVPLLLRIDTPVEVEYYLHGGILPYVLRQLLS
jgi:aconitate hydratase